MKAKDVKNILNITQPTLSKYVKDGLISVIKINDYNYIYNEDDVYRMIGIKKEKHKRFNVSYARVSNRPKNNELIDQSNRIYQFGLIKGIILEKQFEDIKSGMSFDRKDFNEMLKLVIKGKIDYILVENKDRLCRFGFELLVELFKMYGTKILVISDTIQNKSNEQELTDDLISIIHYFSMKSYSNRRKLNKLKKELELETK